jgi:hypothetical protein
MSWGAIIVGGVGMVASAFQGSKNRELAEDQMDDARIQAAAQQERLDKEKVKYERLKFRNPFSNMENKFEDLPINQQQAEFERQTMEQQRANIMQSMRGAAGGSGVASLAQMLANQGQVATQRISASIGQQEARNALLAAQGASAIQTAERQGAQWVQQAEMDRRSTILGMQAGISAGANQAAMQAQANQMNAQIAQQGNMMSFLGTIGSGLAGAGGEDNNIFSKG